MFLAYFSEDVAKIDPKNDSPHFLADPGRPNGDNPQMGVPQEGPKTNQKKYQNELAYSGKSWWTLGA